MYRGKMDYVITPKSGHVNLSPVGFHVWAEHYYKCRHDFKSPDVFSPVPYFLLCRTVELELKSKHLQHKNREHVKKSFGHDLLKLYESLNISQKILTEEELITLKMANAMYKDKGFEYFSPHNAVTGFSGFPNLETLDSIAKKLIDNNV
jgi:hypothetical protein